MPIWHAKNINAPRFKSKNYKKQRSISLMLTLEAVKCQFESCFPWQQRIENYFIFTAKLALEAVTTSLLYLQLLPVSNASKLTQLTLSNRREKDDHF
jgi:hypothetical protein